MAVGQMMVLLAAAGLGLSANGVSPDRHIVLALFSLLLSCFIQVALFTYLTVSGKVVAQAVHLGSRDLDTLARIRRLKRSMIHAVAAMVAGVVFVTATGAVRWRAADGGAIHVAAACAVVLIHAVVLCYEYGLVARTATLVAETLRSYNEHRRTTAANAAGDL